MILLLILAFVAGAVLDNMFAPKITIVDGKLTFEWTTPKDKNKTT